MAEAWCTRCGATPVDVVPFCDKCWDVVKPHINNRTRIEIATQERIDRDAQMLKNKMENNP